MNIVAKINNEHYRAFWSIYGHNDAAERSVNVSFESYRMHFI